jgi:hypothetical protein
MAACSGWRQGESGDLGGGLGTRMLSPLSPFPRFVWLSEMRFLRQLEHLTERFGSRVVSLAEVPAAFVRPRQEGQPLPAPAPAGEPATEE